MPFVEFAYNNNFQTSIGMAPYEVIYGRKCRSPICWDDVGERKLLGLDLVQVTIEKIRLIQAGLKKYGYIDDISCIGRLGCKIRHRLLFNGKIGKKIRLIIDILSIYQIQSDISDSKRYIEDTAGCVEIPKIQTKIIEDWVQKFKQKFQTKFQIFKILQG